MLVNKHFLLFQKCFQKKSFSRSFKVGEGLTLSHMTNFRLCQSESVSRQEKFKFYENGRKFPKQVENTVGKGEIALYEQFLLFPQCFPKDLYGTHIKTRVCLGKG